MPRKSREANILELFFNEPTKQWHLQQIKKCVPIAANKISKWLKKFAREKLIQRVKIKGKMPYYVALHDSSRFTHAKLLFGLQKFHEAGFLEYLSSLEKAKVVILFGSFSRGDWYKESDIDIFLYGIEDDARLGLGKFYFKLHREIQVFSGENPEDLRRLGSPLVKNIIKGICLKGPIPQEVWKYALT